MLVARSELSYYPIEELEVKEKTSRPKKKIEHKQKQRQNRATSFAKLVFLFIPIVILDRKSVV